jgi:hypothetical protein
MIVRKRTRRKRKEKNKVLRNRVKGAGLPNTVKAWMCQDYFGNPAPPKGKFPFIKKLSPLFGVKKRGGEAFMYT